MPATRTETNHLGAHKVSFSEPGLTSLPPTGIYRDGSERYEIRNSKRGHWYAMKIEPDGSLTYMAQNVDLETLTSERQPSAENACMPADTIRMPTTVPERQRLPEKQSGPSVVPCSQCASPSLYASGLCRNHERQRCNDSWTTHVSPSGRGAV
jgi:hypothetical protein